VNISWFSGARRCTIKRPTTANASEKTMIVELVLFKSPPGLDRDAILADARATVPHWQANGDLVRKHYLLGDDGCGGAFYIWPSRAAAEKGHDAQWRAGVKARTGSEPTIRYFDLLMVVDNEAKTVTEFAPPSSVPAGRPIDEVEPEQILR
jgi:hypothetical protein